MFSFPILFWLEGHKLKLQPSVSVKLFKICSVCKSSGIRRLISNKRRWCRCPVASLVNNLVDHCRFLQSRSAHSDSLSWLSCQVLNQPKCWCYLHLEEYLSRRSVSLIILLNQKWWIFVAKQRWLPTSSSFQFIISSIQMIFSGLSFLHDALTNSGICLLCNKTESIKKEKISIWSVFSCFCSKLSKCRGYQTYSSSGFPGISQMNCRESAKSCSQGQSWKD